MLAVRLNSTCRSDEVSDANEPVTVDKSVDPVRLESACGAPASLAGRPASSGSNHSSRLIT